MKTRLFQSILLLCLTLFLTSCGKEETEETIGWEEIDSELNGRYYKATDLYCLKEDGTVGELKLIEDIYKTGVPLEMWFKDGDLYIPAPPPEDSLFGWWHTYLKELSFDSNSIYLYVKREYKKDEHGELTTPGKSLLYERTKGRFFLSTSMADLLLGGHVIYTGDDADDIHKFHQYRIKYEAQKQPNESPMKDFRLFETDQEVAEFVRKTMEHGDHYW